MHVQKIKTPAGEEMVLLSAEDFEDLIDSRDAAVAMAAYRSGQDAGLTDTEVTEYLAAPTPLAFWRKKRGLTQAALAGEVGISQPYLAQIEGGARIGDVALHAKLARALRVRIEDLIDLDTD